MSDTRPPKQSGSLTLAGTGIKFLSHLTQETLTYIKSSSKILYLVNDPLFKDWIKTQHPDTESLDYLYHSQAGRQQSYQRITDYILDTLKSNRHICTIIYGHPCVFSQSGLNAARIARQAGYDTNILPGISAEACLFADLMIDPGSSGCQSFEASDFLIYQRQPDPGSHLILWQIDVIGQKEHSSQVSQQGIQLLQERLLLQYPANHPVVLYEAAQYPGFKAVIEETTLEALTSASLSPLVTLYVPPAFNRKPDERCIKALGRCDSGAPQR